MQATRLALPPLLCHPTSRGVESLQGCLSEATAVLSWPLVVLRPQHRAWPRASCCVRWPCPGKHTEPAGPALDLACGSAGSPVLAITLLLLGLLSEPEEASPLGLGERTAS